MLVRNVMTPTVEILRGGHFLDEAAAKMKRLGVKHLPVLDHGQIAGILSEEDIVSNAIAARRDPSKTQVREIMTAGEITCFENQALEDIVSRMEQVRQNLFIVLNDAQKVVGIVSREELNNKMNRTESFNAPDSL